jgi:acetyltransferase-like isoleucine patch superfamily enzyme
MAQHIEVVSLLLANALSDVRRVLAPALRFIGFGPRPRVGAGAKVSLWRVSMQSNDTIEIGAQSIVEASLITDRSPAVIRIGERSFVGQSRLIAAQSIEIGNDVLISWDVTIVDHDSHALDFDLRAGDVLEWAQGRKDWQYVPVAPVRVADKAWIGFGATILKGVVIGEGAVVASKSVVTKDVEPYTLVGGCPARLIRKLSPRKDVI